MLHLKSWSAVNNCKKISEARMSKPSIVVCLKWGCYTRKDIYSLQAGICLKYLKKWAEPIEACCFSSKVLSLIWFGGLVIKMTWSTITSLSFVWINMDWEPQSPERCLWYLSGYMGSKCLVVSTGVSSLALCETLCFPFNGVCAVTSISLHPCKVCWALAFALSVKFNKSHIKTQPKMLLLIWFYGKTVNV